MVQRTIRKKVKVPLYGQPAGKVASIEDGATMGATIGSTLYFADGTVATLAALAAALGTSSTPTTPSIGLARTLWSLIQEIPENIVEAAALNTAGLVTRQSSGDWITRAIAVASTDRLTITNGDGDAGAPTLDLADLEGLSLWGRSLASTGKPDAITGVANQIARVNGAGTLLEFGSIDLSQAAAVGTSRLAFANIAQITGQAVLGVATAGAGNLAAISAGTNDRLLAQTGGTLAFQQLTVGMIPDATITFAKLQNADALSVLGRASNSSGVLDEIAAAADDTLLRRTSSTINFGALTAGMFPSSLTLSTSFTISGTNIFSATAAAGVTTGPLVISNNGSAYFQWDSTGAASNERRWYMGADNTSFYAFTRTDAGAAGATWLTVDRTGTTIDSIAFAATLATFSGETRFLDATGNASPAISIRSTNPTLHWYETDGGTDDKIWYANVRAEAFNMGVLNDANTLNTIFWAVERTDTAIDSMAWSITNQTLRMGINAGLFEFLGNNTTAAIRASSAGGGTAGDVYFNANCSGLVSWSWGVDRSLTSSWLLVPAAAIDGATPVAVVDSTGNMSLQQSSTTTTCTLARGSVSTSGLAIRGGTTGAQIVAFGSTHATAPSYLYRDAELHIWRNLAGTQRAQMTAGGLWQWSAYGAGTLTTDASGNITAVSDERLKEAIAPFERGLSAVLRLKPITFRYNERSKLERTHRYAGFSAQNVERAIPEAVGRSPDGMRTLQDRALLATLVNAVRELSARVDALERRKAA